MNLFRLVTIWRIKETSAHDTGTGRGDCEGRNHIHIIKIGMGRVNCPICKFYAILRRI